MGIHKNSAYTKVSSRTGGSGTMTVQFLPKGSFGCPGGLVCGEGAPVFFKFLGLENMN